MHISPARQAAFNILLHLETSHLFAVDLLHNSPVNQLDPRDRNLVQELVLGILRRRNQLDFLIEKLSGSFPASLDREVLAALRLGVYQIRYLEKVPKSAAVNDSVELTKRARKRSAAGLVNAVLRKCDRRPLDRFLSNLDNQKAESLRLGHPAWLIERWSRSLGHDTARQLAERNNLPPPITLRVPIGETQRQEVLDSLAGERVVVRPCRFSPVSVRVLKGSVQTTDAFRRGRVAIQDEASQLVTFLLGVREADTVLDLCAAPGMKTRHLSNLAAKVRILACDVSLERLKTARRLSKAGLESSQAPRQPFWICCDGTRQLPFETRFEKVLVDAPCSGTGTLARNPEIKWRLSPDDPAQYADLQRKLLLIGFQNLKPGGRLVYATCSLEPEENEEVVRSVLADEPGLDLISRDQLIQEHPSLDNLFDSHGFFRTQPGRDDMDGFFAAMLTRNSGAGAELRE